MKNIRYNVVGSTMKITASSKVDVSKDLEQENTDNKTIAELLDDQEKQQKDTKK